MGDGELRIVAWQEIGQLGRRNSAPVLFHWRWYHYATTAPLWAAILLLLVLPRANRNRQAWLILVPLLLVLALWRVAILSIGLFGREEIFSSWLVVTWTMAWAAVWLSGHRLRRRYALLTWFSIVAVMLALGVLSFVSSSQESPSFPQFATYYGLVAVSATTAMMLAGRCCRRRFSGMRFGLWLLLWIGVVTVGLPMLIFFACVVIAQMPWNQVAGGLIAIPAVMAMLAGIVYALNLPFLILASYCTFYRSRLEEMFRARPMPDLAAVATASSDVRIETECGSP